MYYICVLPAGTHKMAAFRWNITKITIFMEYAVAQVVEKLLHKLESRGLDSRLGFLIELIILAPLWPRGSTQALTERSTRNISWDLKENGADLTTVICRLCINYDSLKFLKP